MLYKPCTIRYDIVLNLKINMPKDYNRLKDFFEMGYLSTMLGPTIDAPKVSSVSDGVQIKLDDGTVIEGLSKDTTRKAFTIRTGGSFRHYIPVRQNHLGSWTNDLFLEYIITYVQGQGLVVNTSNIILYDKSTVNKFDKVDLPEGYKNALKNNPLYDPPLIRSPTTNPDESKNAPARVVLPYTFQEAEYENIWDPSAKNIFSKISYPINPTSITVPIEDGKKYPMILFFVFFSRGKMHMTKEALEHLHNCAVATGL